MSDFIPTLTEHAWMKRGRIFDLPARYLDRLIVEQAGMRKLPADIQLAQAQINTSRGGDDGATP